MEKKFTQAETGLDGAVSTGWFNSLGTLGDNGSFPSANV